MRADKFKPILITVAGMFGAALLDLAIALFHVYGWAFSNPRFWGAVLRQL